MVSNNKKSGNAKKNTKNNSEKKNPVGVPTAPYNFVKLNDIVIDAPFFHKKSDDVIEQYKQFLVSNKSLYSGYFEVFIENITPLFIGSNTDSFFSDGTNYLIPGSSLRGAIKNYLKIITNGTMQYGEDPDVADKLLYYRSFASEYEPFRRVYKKAMTFTEKDGKKNDKSKGGFLVRSKKEYFICPADYDSVENKKEAQSITNTVKWNDTAVNVYTGPIDKKKIYHKITNPKWNERIVIPEKVLKAYCSDKNANGMRLFDKDGNPILDFSKSAEGSGLQILKGAEQYDFVVPCFYVADNNIVKHFGTGPMYRIPYKKSIGEHIPVKLKRNHIDFSTAIFGNKEKWESRVFFENLYLIDSTGDDFEDKHLLTPLLSANPTSFQNYLEPKGKNAAHWDDSTNIRGYKLYWHKRCAWQMKSAENKQNEDITKFIAPLKEGHIFAGKIRFENLCMEELGALAKVLSLGEDGSSAYKLGMGKSIGLGSVHLSSDLYIQSSKYYSRLFSDGGFYDGLESVDKKNYIKSFEDYVNNVLKDKQESLACYHERMTELKMIMNEKHLEEGDEWAKKTAYMDIDDENDAALANSRIPLPSIKEVVK